MYNMMILHVRGFLGDTFARTSGYNEVAEANHIVILYPQAASQPPVNFNGCWDWTGYTGSNYGRWKGGECARRATEHLGFSYASFDMPGIYLLDQSECFN